MANHPNRDKAARIDAALRRAGLRHHVDAIEPNPATRGEVVLQPYGHPVSSAREAMHYVRGIADASAD